MKAAVHRNRLAAKLLFPVAIISLLLLILALAALREISTRRLVADLKKKGDNIAAIAASATETIQSPHDLRRFIQNLAAEPSVRGLLIATLNPPQVVAASRQDWNDPPLENLPDPTLRALLAPQTAPAPNTFRDGLYYHRFDTRLVLPGSRQPTPAPARAIVVLDPTAASDANHRELGIFFGGGLLALLLLLTTTGYLAYHHVLRPLGLLRDELIKHPVGPLALPGDRSRSPDEIDLLVTALNRAVALSAENERRLEMALRAARQGFYDVDLTTEKITLNREYALLLGEDPETFRPKISDWRERIHPDDIHAQELLRRHLAGETPEYRAEFRLRTRDGSWKWFLSVGAVVERAPNGRPLRMIGTYADISETKRREAELARSEARLRAIFEGSPVGICAADPETGRLVLANPSMARLFNCSPEWLVDREFNALHPNHARAEADERFRRMREGDFAPVVLPCARRDSSEFLAQINARELLLDGRRLLLGFFTDVTAEHQARRALAESRELLIQAQRVARLSSARVRPDGTGLVVAENLAELLGIPPEKATDARELVRLLHPADQTVAESAWRRLVAGESVEVECRLLLPRGERWFLCHGTPDSPARLTIVVRDITERKQAILGLQRAQRLESIGTLAGGVAHDLNNLLSPILISAQLIKLQHPGETRAAEMIEQSAQRAAHIVKQLLTFARGMEGRRGPVQIRHEILQLEKLIASTFDRSIRVVVDCPRDLPPVLADPTQIHQVLLNLCVNARDAMGDRGGELGIRAAPVPANDVPTTGGFGAPPRRRPYIRIEVSDTGCGIPPEIIERIFDPFFTTKPPEKGTGLGLSTVLGIVRAHEGFVRVHSRLGAGSVFEVWLPVAEDQPAPTTSAADRQPRGGGDLALVVDDEEPIRDMLHQLLERWGFRVQVARDGTEALEKARRAGSELRLILTDINMPVCDGPRFLRDYRESGGRAAIVIMTGLHDERRLAEARLGENPPVIHKPFEISIISRLLADWPRPPAAAPATQSTLAAGISDQRDK